MRSRHDEERIMNAMSYNAYMTDDELADEISKRIVATIATVIIACLVALFAVLIGWYMKRNITIKEVSDCMAKIVGEENDKALDKIFIEYSKFILSGGSEEDGKRLYGFYTVVKWNVT